MGTLSRIGLCVGLLAVSLYLLHQSRWEAYKLECLQTVFDGPLVEEFARISADPMRLPGTETNLLHQYLADGDFHAKVFENDYFVSAYATNLPPNVYQTAITLMYANGGHEPGIRPSVSMGVWHKGARRDIPKDPMGFFK